jgi:hypothetical protein
MRCLPAVDEAVCEGGGKVILSPEVACQVGHVMIPEMVWCDQGEIK